MEKILLGKQKKKRRKMSDNKQHASIKEENDEAEPRS